MELVCIDKQTFEELRVRFCKYEHRYHHLKIRFQFFRPAEYPPRRNYSDFLLVCDFPGTCSSLLVYIFS